MTVKGSRETAKWALSVAGVFAVAVGVRLALLLPFPPVPISDFRALVEFGVHLAGAGPWAAGWYWGFANPGVPLVLAALFGFFPADPEAVARLASAVAGGLAAPLPLLLWRRDLPRWAGLAAGLALALWPGQLLFSGVIAQENWALAPTVALAALAVRVMRGAEPAPLAAGMLWALTGAFRQELWLAWAPLGLAAAGLFDRRPGWRRRAARLAFALLLPAAALAGQRALATGRFALTTEHGGLSLLGRVVPGATTTLWRDPRPFLAAHRPELLLDEARLRVEASEVAWVEFRRRPLFQTLRSPTLVAYCLVEGEVELAYWSLMAPGAQRADRREHAARLGMRLAPWLRGWSAVVIAFAGAAMIAGALSRSRTMGILTAAVALKLGVHLFHSVLGRLLIPATALLLVAVVVAAAELAELPRRQRLRRAAIAVGGGVLLAAAAVAVVPWAMAMARAADREEEQLTYRFPLQPPRGAAGLDCEMAEGRLAALTADGRAAVSLPSASGWGGERAAVECEVRRGSPSETLLLRLDDPLTGHPAAGALRVTVQVDGHQALDQVLGRTATGDELAVALPETATRVLLQLSRAEVAPPDAGDVTAVSVPFRVVSSVRPGSTAPP